MLLWYAAVFDVTRDVYYFGLFSLFSVLQPSNLSVIMFGWSLGLCSLVWYAIASFLVIPFGKCPMHSCIEKGYGPKLFDLQI